MLHQRIAALIIRPCSAHKLAHDAPERVLRVGIVLLCLERTLPGQTAENEDARIGPSDRRKTGRYGDRHFSFVCLNCPLLLNIEPNYNYSMHTENPLKVLACTLAMLVLAQSNAGAHNSCDKAACAEVKQKIRTIESRMRAGYTRAQGERYRQRLRELREKRSRTCR